MISGKSHWGEDTCDLILDQLSIGKSLREICSAGEMPSENLVRKWVMQDEGA